MPVHKERAEYKPNKLYKQSKSGISLVYMTIDNHENAKRFSKKLFSKGLIAQAELESSSMERSYLMFGSAHTNKDQVRLVLTTSDDRIKELVDFTNQNSPVLYDYPVQDIITEPVNTGDDDYINWVKKQTGKDQSFKYTDDSDAVEPKK